MNTPKCLAYKATLLLDPDYEYLRKSCNDNERGYARLRDPRNKNKNVYLHRLIYELQTGCAIPNKLQIDHLDRNNANNLFKNLKLVTSSQNQQNTGLRSTNKTGVRGLSFVAGAKKYRARVMVNNKEELAYFELDQKQEAIAWLKKTRAELSEVFVTNDQKPSF